MLEWKVTPPSRGGLLRRLFSFGESLEPKIDAMIHVSGQRSTKNLALCVHLLVSSSDWKIFLFSERKEDDDGGEEGKINIFLFFRLHHSADEDQELFLFSHLDDNLNALRLGTPLQGE
jgi:hypothetical protein